ncbi:MAG: MarR family transcriptional regulator [Rhodospirillaceae bacterium]|jgi:DNA-binding MarR family transcriptional regulator|nr:MarR family transcriptional regulator [Rhodospirillaceae bacterium]MBT5458141.1 MarR family transcriptional regulator [Rhodospirillaceae bacterium]
MSDRGPPENVGFIIGDVSRMLRTVYDRRVEPLGLTRAQWRVLARISRNEGCTQTELAAQLEIEKPTLGRLIDRLQANNWVERRADENDARTKRIFLTPRAQPVLTEMYTLADDVLGAALAGLEKDSAKQLEHSLLHVKSNLTAMLNGGDSES